MQTHAPEQDLEIKMSSEEPGRTMVVGYTEDTENTDDEENVEGRPDSIGDHDPEIRCRLALPNDGDNSVRFRFLAEGAANAVFKILPSTLEQEPCFVFENLSGEPIPRTEITGKVLRISKGKEKTLRYKEIMEGFKGDVVPLFRKSEPSASTKNHIPINEACDEFIMDHQGAALCSEALHSLIAELHTHCPNNRHIEPHHLEERGILLPDMSSKPGSYLTIEIKPKWLAQSPNAPRDAFLCRTCALHASRKSKKEHEGSYICPLQFLSGNTTLIEQYIHSKIQYSDGRPEKSEHVEAVINRVVPYITSGPGRKLLKHIRYLQTALDKDGVCQADATEESIYRLRLAMTLRDCSLFIKVPYANENASIEAKLGDLDFKSNGKIGDWNEKELELCHGGWYLDMDSGMEQCWIAEGWKRYVPYYF